MHGAAIPEDVRGLLTDIDTFISQTLKGENLSKKAKEKKDILLKKIKDVKASYPQEFQDKELEDEEESESSFSSPPDSASIASDRCDKDDEAHSDGNQFPPIAAQDLQFVLKAGYLEKRRKDHSFLGFEWQKRWCAISKTVFYYYGSDKDKQQKGEFALEGYTIRMNNSLRKDAKKDCCFEISAPDKRIYQFTAATPKEAEEWVQQVKFVIQDMESTTIPEEEEEYDDVGHASGEPIDDSIYEELPEENAPPKTEMPRKWSQEKVATASGLSRKGWTKQVPLGSSSAVLFLLQRVERKQRPDFLTHTGRQEQVAMKSLGLLFLERKQKPSHQMLLTLCSAKNMCKTTQLITALAFSTHLDVTVITKVRCHSRAWGQSNYKLDSSIFFTNRSS
uniref:Src kinase associated phosphoprotein 2 n=1 Tax=Gallus gallus TaxID=9031 RepID=A0A8V0X425_CHICK